MTRKHQSERKAQTIQDADARVLLSFQSSSGHEHLPDPVAPPAGQLFRRLAARRRRRLIAAAVVSASVLIGCVSAWVRQEGLFGKVQDVSQSESVERAKQGSRSLENAAARSMSANSDSLPQEAVESAWPYRVQVVWTALVPVFEEREDEEPVVVGWQLRDYALPINPETLQDNERQMIQQVLHQPTSESVIEL